MNKYLVALTAGIALTLLAGCNTKEASSYQNGVRAVEDRDYANAVSLLEKSLVEGEDAKLAYRAIGIAYMGQRDYESAVDAFNKALAESNGLLEDVDYDISYYLAVSFYKLGKDNDALDVLNSILALEESDTAYYLRGKINLINGKKEEAISDFDKTVELAPADYDTYIRICEDLRDAGYDEESNKYIETAMNRKGKMSTYNKGVFEYYLGQYSDARNDLEEAKEKEDNVNLLLYLGRTYEALGDADYASSIYEDALSKSGSSGELYNQLALNKIEKKDYSGALETIEAGISNGDGEAMQELMFNRVVACEYMYDFDKACEYMEEYLAVYPDDAEALREYTFLKSR